jgi:hypothetical protein
MTRRPTWFAATIVLATALPVLAFGLASAGQQQRTSEAGVAGTWSLSLQSSHGSTASMTLEQNGTTVTGTFTSPHGDDVAIAGKFADRELTFTAGVWTFAATLEADGTLEGTMSGAMGDIAWTAKRVE